jgi:hypothetical protein
LGGDQFQISNLKFESSVRLGSQEWEAQGLSLNPYKNTL